MIIWLTILFACSPCKHLCDDMADFAESCGYTVTSDMISECKAQQSDTTWEERQDCREVRPSLEDEWDCSELEIYFGTTNSNTDSTESNDSGNQ